MGKYAMPFLKDMSYTKYVLQCCWRDTRHHQGCTVLTLNFLRKEIFFISVKIDIGQLDKGGVKNPVTDGDMQSHRVMYYGLLKSFPGLSVISEEDDPTPVDMATIEAAEFTDPEVDDVIADMEDVYVPLDEVDVWIDPLDATQVSFTQYTECNDSVELLE